jgi:hypothetical protein
LWKKVRKTRLLLSGKMKINSVGIWVILLLLNCHCSTLL